MSSPTRTAHAFGQTADGRAATLYALHSDALKVAITDFGGRMVSIQARDRMGRWDHVLLGFDDVAAYCRNGGSFGALLGRAANRIANGCFTLDGHTYALSKNDHGSTLHGGTTGFGQVFWRVTAHDATHLALEYISPDGDQGFPGQLSVRAVYRLDGATLSLTLDATTTHATPVSLSAHPYFNLAGLPAREILDHEITLAASRFLPTDARQLPTGEIRDVAGTAFDFLAPATPRARIYEADPQLLYGKGYDHCFVLDGEASTLRLAARARHAPSGRVLELMTTQPALQFYTGNNLDGTFAGRGGTFRQSAGFAFEAQGFPDAPNQPGFPSTILRPGETYRQVIAYAFSSDRT